MIALYENNYYYFLFFDGGSYTYTFIQICDKKYSEVLYLRHKDRQIILCISSGADYFKISNISNDFQHYVHCLNEVQF